MNFEIVELDQFSGSEATIYSILQEGANETLFETFVRENLSQNEAEIQNILNKLSTIGNDTGAREQYFKLNEGRPGDGVCALYDEPDKNLRLYCIRNGKTVVIVGGGGEKPKGMRAFQESEKLTDENDMMREVAEKFMKRIKDRDGLKWVGDSLEGDFRFYDND